MRWPKHGWRLGRVKDPFGHHWEIGKPLVPWPPPDGRPHGSHQCDTERVPESDDSEPRVFRAGGISYLRIPAQDRRSAAAFYHDVFGWEVGLDRDDPSFEDGTGHVIGHFVSDLQVAGEEAGPRPYVYVERVDETLGKVISQGGQMVAAPYPEGDLWVATFRDPAGNVLGIWQQGPRD